MGDLQQLCWHWPGSPQALSSQKRGADPHCAGTGGLVGWLASPARAPAATRGIQVTLCILFTCFKKINKLNLNL